MLVGSMEKYLKQMNADLEKYDGNILKAVLDGHFEGFRCDSGNLSLVLEEDRNALAIMYESTEIDKQISEVKSEMNDQHTSIRRMWRFIKSQKWGSTQILLFF